MTAEIDCQIYGEIKTMRKLSSTLSVTLFAATFALSGCGQRGPLTLPEPTEENQTSSFNDATPAAEQQRQDELAPATN